MAEHDHPVGGRTGGSHGPDALDPGLPALLDLLSDTEEQLLEARLALDEAERRAERATAESAAFRLEIERTTADLADAEARVIEFHRQWLDASAREQSARQELEDMRSSRSWRITAPVRAVTGIRQPRNTGGGG